MTSDPKADDSGRTVSLVRVRRAFAALNECSPEERGQVMCWFCDTCRGYVGPGCNMACDDGHHAIAEKKT